MTRTLLAALVAVSSVNTGLAPSAPPRLKPLGMRGERPAVGPVGAAVAAEGSGPASRPLLGAIRWDAWHGAAGVPGQITEKTLGPEKYHFRLPFFARVVGKDRVEIRGDSPEVMEQEIAYAQAAGLDYWAFVLYEDNTSLSIGLQLYLNSPRRADVRFCVITEAGRWWTRNNYRAALFRLAHLVREPSYQRVLDGRPLIYVGFIEEEWITQTWGSRAGFRQAFDELRAVLVGYGLGNPYLVCLDFNPARGKELAEALGLDAISSYAVAGGREEGAPFAESRQQTRAFWEACRATGAKVVPVVSLGWDPRPRVDYPVPWAQYSPAHFATATPQQLAEHLREALDWTALHREAAPAQALILYAWNENDEGGWLVPTLNPDGTANTERIEAIRALLQSWQPPRPESTGKPGGSG